MKALTIDPFKLALHFASSSDFLFDVENDSTLFTLPFYTERREEIVTLDPKIKVGQSVRIAGDPSKASK